MDLNFQYHMNVIMQHYLIRCLTIFQQTMRVPTPLAFYPPFPSKKASNAFESKSSNKNITNKKKKEEKSQITLS